MDYTNKALLYAEKYGIIDYKVENNFMYYQEFYRNEPNIYVIYNLETTEEYRIPLTIVKNRSLVVGQKVKVYYNLHKKCYSIQSNGLVVAHADSLKLDDATFKVSEKGRQRVLAEKRKNVHAFVVGAFVVKNKMTPNENVYYNPYKHKGFTCDDGSILLSARSVSFDGKNTVFS